MAYKFQIGSAKLAGGILAGGTIQVNDHITGSTMVASNDLELQGATNVVDAVTFESKMSLEAAQLDISGGVGAKLFCFDANNNVGRVRMYSGSAAVVSIHENASNEGAILLYDHNSGSPSAEVKFDVGTLSASSDVDIKGALTIGGNLVVNGDFTGSATAGATVTLAKFETTDERVEFTHAANSGLYWGQGGAGGYIRVNSGTSGWESAINISASHWHGSGAQLTNVTPSGLKLTMNTKTDGQTADLGFNTADATSATVALSLPSIADYGSGVQIVIKRVDASSNSVTVARAGSTSDTIDGAASITLGPDASVTLIANSDLVPKTWMIF